MNKVIIFTDSAADLNKEIYNKNNVQIIPVFINWNNQSFLDTIDIDQQKLLELVEQTGVLPTTAAPNPEIIYQQMKPFYDDGYDIFFFGLGSKISGLFKHCKNLEERFGKDRFFYFDGSNLSSGIGLQVLNAIELVKEGKSAKEIRDILAPRAQNVFCNFSVFTFEFLKKGGRVTPTKAFFAKLLRIKPILGTRNGEMIVRHLSKGKFVKSLDFQLDEINFHFKNNNLLLDYILITHVQSEAADYIKEGLEKLGIKPKNLLETQAGATVASHCGKGTIGIIYEVKDRTLDYLKGKN